MTDTSLTVQDYRIAWRNYHDFVAAWIGRFIFSRGNLIRFGAYALIMMVTLSFPGMAFLGNGTDLKVNELEFQNVLWRVYIVIAVLTAIGFAAAFAFIIGPVIAYLWQSAAFLMRPSTTSTLSLSESGLIKAGAAAETPWSDVIDVHQTAATILIFTGANRGLIVPKLAFANLAAADTFVSFAQSRFTDAHR